MKNPDEFKSKKEALAYCLDVCMENYGYASKQRTKWALIRSACAWDCEIRKHWGIPPHGKNYVEVTGA